MQSRPPLNQGAFQFASYVMKRLDCVPGMQRCNFQLCLEGDRGEKKKALCLFA